MNILFMPFLNMLSGHHQVADNIIESLSSRHKNLLCSKVDILSSFNSVLEKVVSATYLSWIKNAPKSYEKIYNFYASNLKQKRKSFQLCKYLFLREMQQIINRENPDLIVCTHSFPSSLLDILKMRGTIDVPVINVYTDFFINSIWGKQSIEHHFVPHENFKNNLIKQGVNSSDIYMTGIPISEHFTKHNQKTQTNRILISGGSNGLGNINAFLKCVNEDDGYDYLILCGKNLRLYKEIKMWAKDNVEPLPYIKSQEKMNRLYDSVDALISKPGGVTVSEALMKDLPLFLHRGLPGQEEKNAKYLQRNGLVYKLEENMSYISQVKQVLQGSQSYIIKRNRQLYRNSLECNAWQQIELLLNLRTTRLKVGEM